MLTAARFASRPHVHRRQPSFPTDTRSLFCPRQLSGRDMVSQIAYAARPRRGSRCRGPGSSSPVGGPACGRAGRIGFVCPFLQVSLKEPVRILTGAPIFYFLGMTSKTSDYLRRSRTASPWVSCTSRTVGLCARRPSTLSAALHLLRIDTAVVRLCGQLSVHHQRVVLPEAGDIPAAPVRRRFGAGGSSDASSSIGSTIPPAVALPPPRVALALPLALVPLVPLVPLVLLARPAATRPPPPCGPSSPSSK